MKKLIVLVLAIVFLASYAFTGEEWFNLKSHTLDNVPDGTTYGKTPVWSAKGQLITGGDSGWIVNEPSTNGYIPYADDTQDGGIRWGLKNTLDLDNTTEFTPDADYEPATKKYVDDNSGGVPTGELVCSDYTDFATAVSTISTSVDTLVIDDAEPISADVTVPATLSLRFTDDGSLNISSASIVSASYQWTASSSGTNEFYLEASGGGQPQLNGGALSERYQVWVNNSLIKSGLVGSLAVSQWDWADNDTLGYSTIYIRLSDGADPDSKDDGYIETGYIATINSTIIAGLRDIFDGEGTVRLVQSAYPQWWGALPDGSNDDYTAFQSAIDSQPSLGGDVSITSGDWNLATSIMLRTGIRFAGVGARDGIRITATSCNAIESYNSQQVKIENLRIFSNNTAGTWGIYAYNNPRGIYIENVYCDGFGTAKNGGGIYMEYENWGSTLIRPHVERSGYGIYINSASGTNILGGICRQLRGPGLYITDGTAYNIIGGVYEKTSDTYGAAASGGYSVYFDTVTNSKISTIYTEQSIDGLIKIKNSDRVTIENCFIDGITTSILDGIVSLENSEHCEISTNHIRGLYSDIGPNKSCIYLDTDSNYNVIKNNVLENDGVLGTGNVSIDDDGDYNSYEQNSGPDIPIGSTFYPALKELSLPMAVDYKTITDAGFTITDLENGTVYVCDISGATGNKYVYLPEATGSKRTYAISISVGSASYSLRLNPKGSSGDQIITTTAAENYMQSNIIYHFICVVDIADGLWLITTNTGFTKQT